MKNIKYLLLIGCTAIAFSCTPDDPELEGLLSPSDLKYTVTQDPANDHRIFLSSETDGVIPFWDYGLGITNLAIDTLYIPFGGDFWFKYSGLGRAGIVTDSTKISIAENDLTFFADPQWNLLTNGAAGKTWIFDPTNPISYYGPKYTGGPGGSGDEWLYDPGTCPSWSGFPCGTDWGEVTFDLNGRYNLTVKQKSPTGDTYTTKKGNFGFNIASKTLSFIGVPMLSSANSVNWNQAYVFEVSEDVLYLGFVASDGGRVRFKYIPKP
ncbi:hypothetical protein [Ohtaekwangia koreensis]|uniref:PKD domain-containing protein n=1 Tax=Ohtaekwangia koreensis TaxID=688867 RepID=A0A1T5IUH2_9BACT|nr:hypothetical protein [Ohtaekwangia koreensis]SKC42795.1 hypothetical protein SAMN05660236_0421 [Ohtaekwangia koreensis]